MFLGLREKNAAGQGVLRAVGDLQGVVEVAGLDDRQHRAEDFFLGDASPSAARRRRCAGRRSSLRLASEPRSPAYARLRFVLAGLDDLQDALAALRRRSPGRRCSRGSAGATVRLFVASTSRCRNCVVDRFQHDRPRAGRALLALIAERAVDHALAPPRPGRRRRRR